MAEENQVVESQQQQEQETPQQNEVTIEDRAREQGWRPKEEFDGDPGKWVSAETFVAKGELIDRIESLGKKLKDSEKTINLLKEHHAKVKESEFKNAVAYLKAQKKEAYESGDVDKILELDDKIAEVRETQKLQKEQEKVESKEQEPDLHPSYVSWVKDNPWYDKDSEMRADADSIGAAYKRNNPSKTPEEILEHVSGKIKRLYKEYFENPNRSKASSVEGGTTRNGGGTKGSFQLTEEETKVMNTFVRNGIMTKEEYIKQVKDMRG